MRILHLIPFVHFYKPWTYKDIYGGYERQFTHCKVCNKLKNRCANVV